MEHIEVDDAHHEYFIADGDTFLCGDCNEATGAFDVSLDAVEVWEIGSSGWLGPVACRRCGADMDVVVDGAEDAS